MLRTLITGRLLQPCALLVAAIAIVEVESAGAQNSALEPKSEDEWREAANQGTVQILTKGLGCTCTTIASDMANVLNQPGQLRILPVIGHGSLQGIADVLHLRGIDLSILQSDVLAYVDRNGIHQNIKDRVRYVTKLYNSELHLIAGHGVRTIQDLDGRVVSYDVKGRGSFITAENVFESLGITVEPVHLERDVAIEKIRQGEIAAAFVVTGKPADSMRKLKPGDGLHFLPVPLTSELSESYLPSRLTAEDYPQLIESGGSIETIAVPEVLAVYNWSPQNRRYAKVKAVVEKFFDNFDKFKEEVRHPKWHDVDLAADLPGWERFEPARAWLDQRASIASDETYEIKIGDRVLVVKGNRVEGIDDLPTAPEIDDIEALEQQDDPVREIAAEPVYIDVETSASGESDQSLFFQIKLSRPAEENIPIVFRTVGGTAEADVDFKKQNGVMIIEPGATTAELEVELINDDLREGDEHFSLILGIDPTTAELTQDQHQAMISDDD